MKKALRGSITALIGAISCCLILGCASKRINMPQMDLPPEPRKPAIQSRVIMQGNEPFVAYTVPDSLRLYEYLLWKDAYEEKLRYRIKIMNELMEK